MPGPWAAWTWRCDDCGKQYPGEGFKAGRSDCETAWRHHRYACPGKPSMETLAVAGEVL